MYILRAIITFINFLNNLTALKCVFLQVKVQYCEIHIFHLYEAKKQQNNNNNKNWLVKSHVAGRF